MEEQDLYRRGRATRGGEAHRKRARHSRRRTRYYKRMAVDERAFFNEKSETRPGRYQCPKCRRSLFGLAQGRLWREAR